MQYLGGSQLDRIKTQKLRSLRMALKNNYNSYVIHRYVGHGTVS